MSNDSSFKGYALGALLSACVLAPCAQAALPLAVDREPLPSLAPMLERVTPAVVNISTVTQIEAETHPLLSDPFFRYFFELPRNQRRERKNQSLGSGVIVDAEKGLVVTNHHVVDQADAIDVRLRDGRELRAELLGSDSETDIAVLRIPAQGLTAVTLGDSDQLRVGDFVVAIGSPFGLSHTVTSGIVSALGRTGLGIEGFESFIQTDASINPGNSGGPLVDLHGRLVGINTAILAPSGGNVGIGFAIPVAMVRAVADQLLEHGEVRRGLLGVVVQDLTPELARALGVGEADGALVSRVEPGSAAETAGLGPGDLIVAVNGRPITGAGALRAYIGLLRIGTPLQLDLIRNGKRLRLTGKVADPYADYSDGGRLSSTLKGARLGDRIEGAGSDRLFAVAVGTVDKDSPAWRTGLREGDLLLEINQERVRNLEELGRTLRRTRTILSLLIRRDGRVIALRRR
ncbi:MAG: DegQ family serine endoprotease [Candidatus Thiosymbion ectosymbiont of Robbea hypermnestra]|nr:DegQ family serine endoprotease [Candidatus Thiosymbion ectosymbiont of Robbea hypermnestra]